MRELFILIAHLRDKRIGHIDSAPAEVDAHYMLAAGIVGDIADALDRIANQATPKPEGTGKHLHTNLVQVAQQGADDTAYPLKPQRVIADLRRAMADEDVLVCDVGAHKLWVARLFPAERPNTCIISNGFAAMGIALPGALAAKLVLVAYAASFGVRGYRIERAEDLLPALKSALQDKAPSLIDCPIDYHENEKLRQALGEVICQG